MSGKEPAKKRIPKKTKFHFNWDFIERVMPTDQGLGVPVPPRQKPGPRGKRSPRG